MHMLLIVYIVYRHIFIYQTLFIVFTKCWLIKSMDTNWNTILLNSEMKWNLNNILFLTTVIHEITRTGLKMHQNRNRVVITQLLQFATLHGALKMNNAEVWWHVNGAPKNKTSDETWEVKQDVEIGSLTMIARISRPLWPLLFQLWKKVRMCLAEICVVFVFVFCFLGCLVTLSHGPNKENNHCTIIMSVSG